MIASDAIVRAGVVSERARRSGRSLDSTERAILSQAWKIAAEKKLTRYRVNELWMAGERLWDQVLAPTNVVAVFAYYDDPFEEIPAQAQYLIRESNYPALHPGSHVSADQIIEAGFKIPKTPSYDKWVDGGRKVVRS